MIQQRKLIPEIHHERPFLSAAAKRDRLNAAVRAAYGMKPKADPLTFLLALNHAVAAREAQGEPVTAPGLPPCITNPAPFITEDCISLST